MNRFWNRRRATSLLAALAFGITTLMTVGTSPAQAGGSTGWYELCARGTYSSYAQVPSRGNWTTYVASPGDCVPLYMDGSRTEIYGLYPGGSSFHVGTQWWQANIATTGNMGSWGWYVY